MEDSGESRWSFSFGDFRVDSRTGELFRKGTLIRLPAQSFEVLRLLVSRPGELVTRQELQQALWPKESFGDFEHGLNAAVNRLREALGDSADAPRYVETLPRRGYRFIATANGGTSARSMEPAVAIEERRPMEAIAAAAAPLGDSKEPRSAGSRRTLVLALAGVVAAAAGAFGVRALRSGARGWDADGGAHRSYAEVRVTPLTALPGTELAPTFSPDGSQVAFAWDGGNQDKTEPYDLYVKVIGSERLEQLTHRPGAWLVPAWSPDGRNIAFVRRRSGSTGVFMISALGGPERKLADTSERYTVPMSLSWSHDGQLVAYGDEDGIREVSVTDGRVRLLQNVAGCGPMGTPAYSPDGRWLAFSCYRPDMVSYDLEVMPARGGEAKELTRVYDVPQPIAWSADSTRILYSEGAQMLVIGRQGGRADVLAFAHAAIHPAVAVQGDRLAYADWTTNVNLWRMDLRAGREGVTSELAATSRLQCAPDISPDAKRIVFESERSGRHDVWVSNLDGSDAVELGVFRSLTGTPRWSPDGRRIVFDSRESGQAGLYIVDPQEGVPRSLNTGGLTAEVPRWSRDGRWIYFNVITSKEWSTGIYKVPAAGGAPVRVTSTRAINPQEDRSGRTLYYMIGDTDASIRALDLVTGQERDLEGMPIVDGPTDWVVGSRGIYFIDPATKPATIDFYDFAVRRVTKRFRLPKPPDFWGGLSLAPDESWVAYSQVDRSDSDLMLAEPFR